MLTVKQISIFALVFIGVVCIYYYFKILNGERSTEASHAKIIEEDIKLKEITLLARSLKNAGIRLYGTSWCKFSRLQLEMFGDSSKEARQIINSLYVNCEAEECPTKVRGYPTWAYGDVYKAGILSFPGLISLLQEAEINSKTIDSTIHQEVESNIEGKTEPETIEPERRAVIMTVQAEPAPSTVKIEEVKDEVKEVKENEELQKKNEKEKVENQIEVEDEILFLPSDSRGSENETTKVKKRKRSNKRITTSDKVVAEVGALEE